VMVHRFCEFDYETHIGKAMNVTHAFEVKAITLLQVICNKGSYGQFD